MRITEQEESFAQLSIACRQPSQDGTSYSSSELTMPKNEAENLTPGSPSSSSVSSVMMTPETSDDEDDDLRLSPVPTYKNSRDSWNGLLGVETPFAEQYERGGTERFPSFEDARPRFDDEHEARLSTASESLEEEDEDSLHVSEAASENSDAVEIDLLGIPSELPETTKHGRENLNHVSEVGPTRCEDDTGLNPLASPTAIQSDDECDQFLDALTGPAPFYGSRLSYTRETDKATVEEIGRGVSTEMTRAQRRVLRELRRFHEDETTPFLSVAPIDGNLLNCLASMEGAWGTPYENGIFWLRFQYLEDYPMKAPVITFLTEVYHPNIENGRICIDILETSWSPCLQIQTLLLSILSVLHHPILDDALVPRIAEKYQLDYDDFCEMARLYTEGGAHGIRPDTSNLRSSTSGDSS